MNTPEKAGGCDDEQISAEGKVSESLGEALWPHSVLRDFSGPGAQQVEVLEVRWAAGAAGAAGAGLIFAILSAE